MNSKIEKLSYEELIKALDRLKTTKDFLKEQYQKEVKNCPFPEIKPLVKHTYEDNKRAFDIAIKAIEEFNCQQAELQKLINEIAYLKVGNPGYENREFILRGAVDTFGADTQFDIAIEEMSELIKAIIKYRRYNTPVTLGAVCEEIADVLIMMEQLRIITNSEIVDQYFFDKIQRLDSRIKEYESAHKRTTSDRVFKTFIGGDGI